MTAFWTNPSALMWTNPTGLFWVSSAPWTESWPGGIGSFSFGSGTYTVGGTGLGVTGISDGVCFVSQPATGNIEFIAYVSGQTSSDPYAIAGLMLRDQISEAGAQCAFIGVSPQNGVNFSYRTQDAIEAQITMGPSLAAPIWLKLVVSQ